MTSELSESDLELQSKDNTPYFLSPDETIIVLVEQLYRTWQHFVVQKPTQHQAS